MKNRKTLTSLIFVISSFASMAAYAWSIQEDHGTWALIRCVDGSNATVEQLSNGYWTVTVAGNNGTTGGEFAIMGQAAVKGCGPE